MLFVFGFQHPTTSNDDYIRHDAITDYIFNLAQNQYGKEVTKEDIFYYVYGFLHSPQYRETFAADLKKMLPRLPLVEDPSDFWSFSQAGRKLAYLHLNYETVPPHSAVTEIATTNLDDAFDFYKVQKMKFPAKDQKDTIIYNSRITLQNIPPEAYEYVVNGKSAIDWIIERYQITTHADSGITNNPNHWAEETNNPRYIIDLLHSVINLSVQTVQIVNSLPKITFKE